MPTIFVNKSPKNHEILCLTENVELETVRTCANPVDLKKDFNRFLFSNHYFVVNIRFITTEKEPSEVWVPRPPPSRPWSTNQPWELSAELAAQKAAQRAAQRAAEPGLFS